SQHVGSELHRNVPGVVGFPFRNGVAQGLERMDELPAGLCVCGVFRAAARLKQAQLRVQVVAALQKQVDDAGVDPQRAAAQLIEHAFQDVGEVFDGGQFHYTRSALDRMRRTEDGVQQIVIASGLLPLFHSQQPVFHGGKLLACFLDKDLENLIHWCFLCRAARTSPCCDRVPSSVVSVDAGSRRVVEKAAQAAKLDHVVYRRAGGHDAHEMPSSGGRAPCDQE